MISPRLSGKIRAYVKSRRLDRRAGVPQAELGGYLVPLSETAQLVRLLARYALGDGGVSPAHLALIAAAYDEARKARSRRPIEHRLTQRQTRDMLQAARQLGLLTPVRRPARRVPPRPRPTRS